jgi:hypothetical protein
VAVVEHLHKIFQLALLSSRMLLVEVEVKVRLLLGASHFQ